MSVPKFLQGEHIICCMCKKPSLLEEAWETNNENEFLCDPCQRKEWCGKSWKIQDEQFAKELQKKAKNKF